MPAKPALVAPHCLRRLHAAAERYLDHPITLIVFIRARSAWWYGTQLI